ncbi:hypothetical protein [Alloactinosynnema sp. L-07]|nr:hypothetical protein [Alloactinosynnema sp. L-07]
MWPGSITTTRPVAGGFCVVGFADAVGGTVVGAALDDVGSADGDDDGGGVVDGVDGDDDVVTTGSACPDWAAGPAHADIAAARAPAAARAVACRLSTAPTMPQVGAH